VMQCVLQCVVQSMLQCVLQRVLQCEAVERQLPLVCCRVGQQYGTRVAVRDAGCVAVCFAACSRRKAAVIGL